MKSNYEAVLKSKNVKMYQVSTLQALAMGHTRPVVNVAELKKHGNTGLGTFEGVNGEMIVADGQCFRAKDDGSVVAADEDMGVPFASVSILSEVSALIYRKCAVLKI